MLLYMQPAMQCECSSCFGTNAVQSWLVSEGKRLVNASERHETSTCAFTFLLFYFYSIEEILDSPDSQFSSEEDSVSDASAMVWFLSEAVAELPTGRCAHRIGSITFV